MRHETVSDQGGEGEERQVDRLSIFRRYLECELQSNNRLGKDRDSGGSRREMRKRGDRREKRKRRRWKGREEGGGRKEGGGEREV